LAWPLRQKPLAARRGLLATLPAQRGACIHNWTSREPVFAAGKEDMLGQPLNKGLVLPAYLLTSLALRSDGVLYLIWQMKEIDLEVESERNEHDDKKQSTHEVHTWQWI
jgi:hypothetical protein